MLYRKQHYPHLTASNSLANLVLRSEIRVELVEEFLKFLSAHVSQHVKSASMWHPYHETINPPRVSNVDYLLHGWDQYLNKVSFQGCWIATLRRNSIC